MALQPVSFKQSNRYSDVFPPTHILISIVTTSNSLKIIPAHKGRAQTYRNTVTPINATKVTAALTIAVLLLAI
jgi:hypothetical protein